MLDIPGKTLSDVPCVNVEESYRYLHMDGREVFRFAVGAMEESIHRVLEKSPYALEDVDLIIPHQANIRILASVARHMKLPMERFYVNLDRFGNTSAASVPIALSQASEEDAYTKIKLLLVGFGGGLTYAASGSSCREDRMLLNEMFSVKYPVIQGRWRISPLRICGCSIQRRRGVIGTGAMTINRHGGHPLPFADRSAVRCQCDDDESLYERADGDDRSGTCRPGDDRCQQSGRIHVDAEGERRKVFPVVPSVAMAIRMERSGADGLIVEGGEAGGHVGEQTTMALLPQVVDAVSIPVVAAGGIADSRGFAAALCLGAIGVQVGTCLLVSEECPIHENYKNAVIKAKDTDTVVTGRSLNSPVRILKNPMSRQYIKLEARLPAAMS
ncbi:MAG: nitronate monooxygenase [Merdibacter sp.]